MNDIGLSDVHDDSLRLIPKQLHRVLVWDYDPGPDSHNWWRQFGELHPDWELVTWGDPVSPDDWELGRLFRSCSSGAQLADLLRLEILWRQGGVYVDSDMQPMGSLEPLLDTSAFIGTENGKQVSSGIIGAVPRHPAIRLMMDHLLERERLPMGQPPNVTTGPYMYTRLLDNREDVLVLPRVLFYPTGWMRLSEEDRARDMRHALTTHHWAASWVPKAEPRRLGPRLIRRLRRTVGSGVSALRFDLQPRLSGASGTAASGGQLAGAAPCLHLGNNRVLVETVFKFGLVVSSDDQASLAWLARDRGLGRIREHEFLRRVVRQGDWVLDASGDDGFYAIASAIRAGRWGKVLSERDDPSSGLLEIAAAANSLKSVKMIRDARFLGVPHVTPLRLTILRPRICDEFIDIVTRSPMDFVLLHVDAGDYDAWLNALRIANRLLHRLSAKAATINEAGQLSFLSFDELSTRTRPCSVVLEIST